MENELTHYGVLGMHWGVRKQPQSSGTGRRRDAIASKARQAQDKVAAYRKQKILSNPSKLRKHYKEFSDSEIKEALKNFSTEQQLDNYQQAKQKKGKRIATGILAGAGTGIVLTGLGAAAVGAVASQKYGNTGFVFSGSKDHRTFYNTSKVREYCDVGENAAKKILGAFTFGAKKK